MPHRTVPAFFAAMIAVASLSAGTVAALAATPTARESGGSAPTLQMPTDPAEALRVYESDVDDWVGGPVRYLLLPDERDEWEELETEEEKRDFIRWFWDRRDEELRDRVNQFQIDFYTRVATANRRFSGFPRGWRSDRGRVWTVLGRPDNVKVDMGTELEIWTYFTYGGILRAESVMGEMQVAFIRRDTATWEIYGGIGPGAWPPYVLRALEIVNRAQIMHPDLERIG